MRFDDPRLKALLEQIDQLLLVLERPVVQRQLLALVSIAMIAWILAEIIHHVSKRLVARRSPQEGRIDSGRSFWLHILLRLWLALGYTFFPLMGMISGLFMVDYFRQQGWPYGLVDRWLAIFWLLLGYRIVVALFYALMDQSRARNYHRRLLLPLFIIVVIVVLNNSVVGTLSVGDIELLYLLESPITIASLFTALVVLYFFLVGSRILQSMLSRFLSRSAADSGVTNTVLTISRYAIVVIGILTSLSVLGLDLSTIAIIGGGLSVGIGFGMQDLFANFFSGILLLFDQTLRPGDVIEIAGQRGTVDQMRIRSTVIRTPTNVEVYVPNKTLLTSAVLAHTHATVPAAPSRVREILTINVEYESNLDEVRRILIQAVHQHKLVLADPEPTVYLVRFGAATVDFEIGIWVEPPEKARQVVSELGMIIWREFQRRDIRMKSPQPEATPVEAT